MVHLSGLFLAQFHPETVLVTDLAEVVPLLSANILLNAHLAPNPDIAAFFQCRYAASALPWGEEIPETILVTKWDVLVASDVVYAPECYLPLYTTLRALLTHNPLCKCIIAHRHRNPEDPKFFALLHDDPRLTVKEVLWRDELGDLTGMSASEDIKLFVISYISEN